MKIKRKHAWHIVGVFVIGFGIGLVIYDQLISPPKYASYGTDNEYIESDIKNLQEDDNDAVTSPMTIDGTSDQSEAITAGKNNPLVVINDTDKKLYESDNLRFEIFYPAEFEIAREEYSECYKETSDGGEKVINPADIHIPTHTKVPIVFEQRGTGGEEGTVFRGMLGYRYLPDCVMPKFVMDMRIMEKTPGLSSSTYIDDIIQLYADRRKEYNMLAEGEGPFKITKKVNGEDVQIMRIKAGEGFYQHTDIYYFENEKYLYELSHMYNYPDLILPRSHDHYVQELRDYEIGMRAIEGFKLKK